MKWDYVGEVAALSCTVLMNAICCFCFVMSCNHLIIEDECKDQFVLFCCLTLYYYSHCSDVQDCCRTFYCAFIVVRMQKYKENTDLPNILQEILQFLYMHKHNHKNVGIKEYTEETY